MGERFVKLALEQTDLRIQQDQPVSPGFLFATLLWHEVLAAWEANLKQGMRKIQALHQAMDDVLKQQSAQLNIPRRFDAVMNEIWQLQPRFLDRAGARPFRLLATRAFAPATIFCRCVARAARSTPNSVPGGKNSNRLDASERQEMLLVETAEPAKKRRRRKRKSAAAGP